MNEEYEDFSKGFLAGWITTLLESIEENVDEETKEKIFQQTGSYCFQQHAAAFIQKVKDSTDSFSAFLAALNKNLKGTHWEEIDDQTLKVVYDECFCPIIKKELYDSPMQCNCSVGWLKKNLESVLERPVTVTLEKSVLQGNSQCSFKVKYDQ